MKNFFRKCIAVICTVSAAAAISLAAITVHADEVPRTQDQLGQVNVTDTVGASAGTASNTGAASGSSGVNSASVTQSAGKAATKSSGGFWWFLLSVAVNFVISCWVANRFYRMSKKSTQSSAEIRALRKDIEEKFAGTLKDISEPAIEVINRNESYARSDEGLVMPERKSHVELNEDELEMMRRWDSKRTASKPEPEEEEDDYAEDVPARNSFKRSYQPARRSAGIEFEDDEQYDDSEGHEARRPSRRPLNKDKAASAFSSAKNKAKNLLGNVFPFDE